jgi:tetratricopeptide (TPR) repeat protein
LKIRNNLKPKPMKSQDINLISDYLAGDLSPEEEAKVASRLESESEFAALMETHHKQVDILRAASRAELKATLREQMEFVQQQQSITRNLWTFGAIAAAAAVMLMIWLVPKYMTSPSTEQLAMGYLEPYSITTERGEAPLQNEAFSLYQKGDFRHALPLLDSLHRLSPGDQIVSLYLAESLSLTGEYREAAMLFEQLAADSPFKDAAEWRLALNLLLAGEKAAAHEVLERIASGEHYKQKAAKRVLKGM